MTVPPASASELETPPDRLPSGARPIDELLGGGLEAGALTQVYGEGGTGKTIFALSAAIGCALAGRWVFYIDTEGVSMDRLRAMSRGEPERVFRRLLLSSPPDLARQTEAVRTAVQLAREGRRPIGLIVLDSATLYYRLSLGTDEEDEARRQLLQQLAELLSGSLAGHFPVLFTNQVFRNVTSGDLEPIGGPFVNHLSKTILRMERGPGDRRRAVLVKHRDRPERAVPYRITALGLE